MKYTFEQAGTSIEIDVERTGEGLLLSGPDGNKHLIVLEPLPDGSQRAVTPWGDIFLHSARRGAELWAQLGARRIDARVERRRPSAAGSASAETAGAVRAPMAGKLLRVEVKVGDSVRAGQALAVVEAMKMENELTAPFAGTVVELAEGAPCAIEKGALVVRLSLP